MNNLSKWFLLTFVVGLLQVQSSFAQFGVGIGLNTGIPMGDLSDNSNFGFGGYLEPKYLINDNFSAGVTWAGYIFSGADLDLTGASLSATSIVPITAFGEYTFSGSKVTPYVGLGVGPYFIGGGDVEFDFGGPIAGELGIESRTEFGFAPRVGVYIGKFNVGASYNIVKDASFLAFKMGFDIGARRNY